MPATILWQALIRTVGVNHVERKVTVRTLVSLASLTASPVACSPLSRGNNWADTHIQSVKPGSFLQRLLKFLCRMMNLSSLWRLLLPLLPHRAGRGTGLWTAGTPSAPEDPGALNQNVNMRVRMDRFEATLSLMNDTLLKMQARDAAGEF